MNNEPLENLLAAAKAVVEQHRSYKKGCGCAPCRLKDAVDKLNETETVSN